MRKKKTGLFLLSIALLSAPLFSCQPTPVSSPDSSFSSSSMIQGLAVAVVDNDVFEIGDSCSYPVTLPGGASASWSLYDNQSKTYKEASNLTSSFSIEYTFASYGDYSLKVVASSGALNYEKVFALHCLDLSKASISVMPSDKTIEAGTLYSFQTDLSSIQASDNSSSALSRRVVRILYQGQSVAHAHAISSYQFKESGEYTIEVEVSDLNENIVRSSYRIRVQDTTSPRLSGESAYSSYFDENYDIVLPDIAIEEYSPYTISYRLVSLDGYATQVAGNKLLEPHIGVYSLTYSVDDAINPISTFSTRLTVKNNAPTFAFDNHLGTLYDSTAFSLPAPAVTSLSGVSCGYSSDDPSLVSLSGSQAIISKAGTYSIHCAVNATYYLGGEKHKEDGSKSLSFAGDISVEVSARGTLDMESHNGSSPTIWNSSDSNVIRLTSNQGVSDSTALEFDTMLIGWNRFASLLNPIPVPDHFDGLRVWVKCGGVNPKGFMYVILEDTFGQQARADFYISPLEGRYYTVALTGSSIANIKRICIANRLGENGETVTDPETGAVSSIGEDRTFYLDDLSLLTMPVLEVDTSSLSPVMKAGDTVNLPHETIKNWDGSHTCIISASHNGRTIAVSNYALSSLEEGDYTFTYQVEAGGASLSTQFTIHVYPAVTSVVLYNNYGLLRVGETAPLPKAYLIAMPGLDASQGQYSLAYGAEVAQSVTGSLPALKAGTYTISYAIVYQGKTYADSFAFRVAGAPSAFTFDPINSGTDGEIQEVIGDASPSAEIQQGSLLLNGWWGGALFTEDLTLSGMTDFYLNVLSKTGLSHTAVYYLDQSKRTGSSGWHSTEDLGIFFDLPANQMTTIHIAVPSSVTGICAFAILTKNTEVAVDKVWLEAKVSKVPAGKTGIFGLSDYVSVTPLDATQLANDPTDDSLRVFGQWVCSFTLGADQVQIPATATTLHLRMKANQAYQGMFIRLTTAAGFVYDDETAGVDLTQEYQDYSLPLLAAGVGSSLSKCEFWVQDDSNVPGWKILQILSFTFGGSNA